MSDQAGGDSTDHLDRRPQLSTAKSVDDEINQEDIPEALNDLVSVLEQKAAKFKLSRSNVKNILKHVMQSEEMVSLLHDELCSSDSTSTVLPATNVGAPPSSSSPGLACYSMRMTRQRFRQLAGDKVCPDLEVLLSRLPQAPSAPKSFFEMDFPEDDPEDVEYDPCMEEEDDDDAELEDGDTSLTSPTLGGNNHTVTPAVVASQATDERTDGAVSSSSNFRAVSECVTLTPSTSKANSQEELIACRTRSRYPLVNVNLDVLAPLPPELRFDVDSLSPPSPSYSINESCLLSTLPTRHLGRFGTEGGSPASTNPAADDDEIYADFLATVFESSESGGASKDVPSTTASRQANVVEQELRNGSAQSSIVPEQTRLSAATDEDQDDPDYNPFQDIDILLTHDPDEYIWDKRARIPKEEVRNLRKEAFADLPLHCHLLETCAEATTTAASISRGRSGEVDAIARQNADSPSTSRLLSTTPSSSRKRSAASACKSTSKSKAARIGSAAKSSRISSSSSETSEVDEEDSNYETTDGAFNQHFNQQVTSGDLLTEEQASSQDTFVPNESQILVLKEQMRKHIQLLLQTYIMAGDAPEATAVSEQSMSFLSELESLRVSSPHAEQSCFNVFNLPLALKFLEQWPPSSIGSPEPFVPKRNVSAAPQSRRRLRALMPQNCLPSLSDLQKDLMTFYCPALLYAGLLPDDKGFQNIDGIKAKRIPWLPSEDDLLALGLEQFWAAGKLFKEKAAAIHKYLLPSKSTLAIRARMKNVFYGFQYAEADNSNPIKMFQTYGMAPHYETAVCIFRPEEVVPLCSLPRKCLPNWMLSRIDFWNQCPADAAVTDQATQQLSKVVYVPTEHSDKANENRRPISQDPDGSCGRTVLVLTEAGEVVCSGLEDEIELVRGTTHGELTPSQSENVNISSFNQGQEQASSSEDAQIDPPSRPATDGDNLQCGSVLPDCPVVPPSPTQSTPEQPSTIALQHSSFGDTLNSLADSDGSDNDDSQQLLATHGSKSPVNCSPPPIVPGVVEEDAVFLTPVKQTDQSLVPKNQFDSDLRSVAGSDATVNAASRGSLLDCQKLSNTEQSPLRARRPLLAKLLSSLTPKEDCPSSSSAALPVALVIGPVSSATPPISPAIRPKRRRRSSTSAATPRSATSEKLRLIAPAPPPPKSLLGDAEDSLSNRLANTAAPSPSPGKSSNSKMADTIRARALKQSRFAAIKRSLLGGLSHSPPNSNANPPQEFSPEDEPPTKTLLITAFSSPSRLDAQKTVASRGTARFGEVTSSQPARRRPTVRKRHPSKLNEKQKQKLLDIHSASCSARLMAACRVRSEAVGSALPFSDITTDMRSTVGETQSGPLLLDTEAELARSYLDLLESSLPQHVFGEVVKLFELWHTKAQSTDTWSIKELYASLHSLLMSVDRLDLLTYFTCFLTSYQAYECGCYKDFSEFDAVCDFLVQHQAAFGGRSSLKSLQSLIRMFSSLSPHQTFSSLETELTQLLGSQTGLVDQLAALFAADHPPPSRQNSDLDCFETIDLTSETSHISPSTSSSLPLQTAYSRHVAEYENVRLPRSKYGTQNCPCDCHSGGLLAKVSNAVLAHFADRKRHCRLCGISVTDGKLYVPDPRISFRMKRVPILVDRYQQILKHYYTV